MSEESCRAQFLVPVTAQGQNRAQASLERAQNLNPMVEVHADSDRIEDKPDDFFLQFEAVSDLWQMCPNLFQASKHNKKSTFIGNACQLYTSSPSYWKTWKTGVPNVDHMMWLGFLKWKVSWFFVRTRINRDCMCSSIVSFRLFLSVVSPSPDH